jgi:hypothetical protein
LRRLRLVLRVTASVRVRLLRGLARDRLPESDLETWSERVRARDREKEASNRP